MSGRTITGRAGAWLLLGLVLVLGVVLFVVGRALRAPSAASRAGGVVRDVRSDPSHAPGDALERPAHAEAPAPEAAEHDAARASNRRTSDAALVVTVTSASGEPWTAAFELWIEHVPRPGTRSLRPGAYARHSGAEVRVEALAPGDYAFHVRAAGRRSADGRVRLAEGEVGTARVVLERAGTVRGRLLDGAEALDGVAVRLVSKDGRRADATVTDGEGRFVFESVLEGPWRLAVGPPHDPLVKDWTLEYRGTELDLGERALEGLTTLLVTVRDAHGNPVAGARVWDGEMSGHFDLRTDEQGRARARHLPPRQYRVFAEHADHGRENRPVRVEAHTPADVELELAR